MITYSQVQFGNYILKEVGTGKDILIQTESDKIGIAQTFGWSGTEYQAEEAINFLDKNEGKEVDDPGYFTE